MMIKLKIVQVFVALSLLAAVFTIAPPADDANAALVSGSKFLGNVIASNVPSNFSTYWNQVTPENSTKWGSVEGSRNNMNWSQADTAYNYARNNNMPFKFHTLVWGSQEPGWIGGLSAVDQKAEVIQWINAAAQRYPNAQYVDVVNEPLHAKPSYRNAIGGDGSTGWDWVIWSFQEARRAFPNAKLLINEYGIISDPNAASQYVTIINLLKSRGLIDGIGIQSHYFNMDNVSVTTMNNVLNTLAATGLPIYVSELDMTGDDNTQLQRYQQKFPVLWEHPAVKGITLWGYIEGQTWASNTHLIRSNGTERPALQWLRTYLGGGSGGGGTIVQAESMTKSGPYAGNISSPFTGVALYANNDLVKFTQNFTIGTHSFSIRAASNNNNTARVDLRIGGQTKGTFYLSGTSPAIYTLNNVSHGTGNQEIQLIVTADNGSWDAFIDYLEIK